MEQKRKVWTAGISALLTSAALLATPAHSSDGQYKDTLQLLKERQEVASKQLGVKDRSPLDDFDVQVLISASMPDASLRALFAQANAYGPEKVRFVIRGFEPKKLAQTIAYFRRFFPDPAQDFVIMEVDPNTFRTVGAKSVPIFLVKHKPGQWWETHGEISLRGAMEYVKNNKNKLVAGPLYPIQEPDVLEILQAEMKKDKWSSVKARLEQQASNPVVQSQHNLPFARKSQRTLHTPAVALVEDVAVPDPNTGKEITLAKAGQWINPLESTQNPKTILVISAEDERQLRWAEYQIKHSPSSYDIFFVGKAELAKLANRFKPAPVWPLWNVFAEGFGVKAVPSKIKQKGTQFIIDEFNVDSLGAAK